MRIKLWELEYDFDKEDGKIVIPILLLALALAVTEFKRDWLLAGVAGYYLLYFFLPPLVGVVASGASRLAHWWHFRCKHCRGRDLIMQGYQGYHSDEQYAYYLCNKCFETSVLVGERMMKALSKQSK